MPKVSSFNIRCYGLGGEYSGRFRDEKRNHKLKQLIAAELSDCDVMVFQEIVDVESFKLLLPEGYNTFIYEHDYNRHQRVIICTKSSFTLTDTQKIPGTVLDERFSRPALYGQLNQKDSNSPILHVIGVHLKSGHLHTDTRLQQATAIVEFIKTLDTKIPVVLTGDFNSQAKEQTKFELDDKDLLNEVFQKIDLKLIENEIYTYHTHWEKQVLDHFWVSKNIKNPSLSVYDITKYNGDLKTYYSEISDHLPLKLIF